MIQSRARRRHDRERVIANRTRLAVVSSKNYFGPTQTIKGGYFDTHKPHGSCGNAHCRFCKLEQAEKREAVKKSRRQARKVERLTTSEND